jgi:hypothetical protein
VKNIFEKKNRKKKSRVENYQLKDDLQTIMISRFNKIKIIEIIKVLVTLKASETVNRIPQ